MIPSPREELLRQFDEDSGWCYPCTRRWVTPSDWARHITRDHADTVRARALTLAGIR